MIGIYHSNDFDGVCSGAIMQHKYPQIELMGYDYGEPFPWEKIKGQDVIMADVSLPMEEMRKLYTYSRHFVWIDHHASAINDYRIFVGDSDNNYYPMFDSDKFLAVLDSKLSACELCWLYFFPEKEMPKIIEYLGRYDRWDKSDPKFFNEVLLPFQYGMRASFSLDVKDFPWTFFSVYGDHSLSVITENGRAVLSYQSRQDALICEQRAFDATICGLKAACCNGVPHNSQSFNSYYDPDFHQLMVAFHYDGTQFNFSLYSTHLEVDCSEIAKRFGGGGHKGAAGFKLSPAETPTFFATKILDR